MEKSVISLHIGMMRKSCLHGGVSGRQDLHRARDGGRESGSGGMIPPWVLANNWAGVSWGGAIGGLAGLLAGAGAWLFLALAQSWRQSIRVLSGAVTGGVAGVCWTGAFRKNAGGIDKITLRQDHRLGEQMSDGLRPRIFRGAGAGRGADVRR